MKFRLSLIFLFISFLVFGQIPKRPVPPRLYNNLSKQFPAFLSATEAAELEKKLEQFSNETSNQICVVVIDDLGGLEASEFSFKLGNEWGVGLKEKDNGIVVTVKPTESDGGRDLFIAVGEGLEGAIPDVAAKRIVRDDMVPYLKNGQNYDAINNGVDKLIAFAKGEINVKDERPRNGIGKKTPLGVIITLIIIFIIIRSIFGGGRGGRTLSRRGGTVFWGSPFGGGGRSWGGGSSGGGWGGFGGGSFGGGGAGSKW